jgi:hypothetical protein
MAVKRSICVNLLSVEIDHGSGWLESWRDDVPHGVTIDMIALDIQRYAEATGQPHQARLNGIVVAGYNPQRGKQ